MAQVTRNLMSKKTKQEKIIADLRRQLEATKTVTNSISEQINYPLPKRTATLPSFSSPQDTKTIAFSQDSLGLIKKDLTKTLLLSILAISFELVLYFLLGTGTIK